MIKNLLRVKPLLFALLAFIGSMWSCTKEDMTDCGGVRLYFAHTFNEQGQDLLASSVKDIRVYIFDNSGLLFDVLRINAQDLTDGYKEVDLETGTYTAVAWAGSSDDVLAGGYMDVEMTDPQAHLYISPVRVGVTTLSNFRMLIRNNVLPTEVRGDVAPEVDDFDDLFHSHAESFEVKRGGDQRVYFDFVKNTNTLKIRINGLECLGSSAAPAPRGRSGVEPPLSVYATGSNGRYTYSNQIGEYAREVRYERPHTYLDNTTMEVDIKILRLMLDQSTAQSANLYITDPATGAELLPAIDILGALLKVRSAAIVSQEDLDRIDEIPIEINIDVNLGVSVSIFGYKVISSETELQ